MHPLVGMYARTGGHEQVRTVSYGAVRLRYLLHHPPGSGPHPLILFLHGVAERGGDIELVRRHGIPREIATGRDLRCIAASPQCPSGWTWTELTDVLRALLDQVFETEPVDPDRVYVTGLSMGGYGTWRLAAEDADRFAAAVPICGGGDPRWAPRLSRMPVWAFHGTEDRIVPPSATIEMVRALAELGAPVRLTLYRGVGHDSWTPTYRDPRLYEWLLAQHRPEAEAPVAPAHRPRA